ncbi:hypothetical protein UFOVP1038_2 [uncultured Caudovirales phage]|uniref:Uncharacterized protein n=1 Tax=uncultured Caudovirales phage TaxID=2100421 RepID=A0A6J5Q5R2_9CAUD|nr:hypothetical protein UFOVP1038_2 [uncultured Caudovirales phage]
MTVPTVQAFINFSTGPSFAQSMILDSGILGTNVLADAAAVIVDVSNQINSISIQRGRNAQADQFQAGTLSLRIIDQNGDFNPQNVSGPYYNLLTPMRKVSITATSLGVVYPLFSGFITNYLTTQPNNSTDTLNYTTIQATDAMRLVQMAQITTVAGSTSGDLTGTRVNLILDQIDWPASMRDVDAGLTTVQANPDTATTALIACQKMELAEFGAFYVDASGSFVFQDRNLTASSIDLPARVFNDNGSNLHYFNADWILNDVLVYNQASITKIGGTAQTAENAASVEKYFSHSYNQTNQMFLTDAQALDYAKTYIASRAETSIRCDSLILDLYYPDEPMVLAALELDFFDPITVSTTQPGGSVLTKTLQIFGVSYSITPNSWRQTFTTLEPILDAFILDYSKLDDATSILSY